MHSYSVCKLVPPTVLSFGIVTKCRVTVYVLNIFVGSLSPAFRKIIRLKKNLYECFSWFFPDSGSLRDHQHIDTWYHMWCWVLWVLINWLTMSQQAHKNKHELITFLLSHTVLHSQDPQLHFKMAGYDACNQLFQTRLIGTALGQDRIGVFVPSSIISQDKIRVGTVFITTVDLIKLISCTREVNFRRGMKILHFSLNHLIVISLRDTTIILVGLMPRAAHRTVWQVRPYNWWSGDGYSSTIHCPSSLLSRSPTGMGRVRRWL